MNKSVSLLLLWHIWKWLRFIFMSLNSYVPYDAFNVSLVEKLSWICRKYRLYHEIHQENIRNNTILKPLLYRVGWSDPWSDDPDYLPVSLWYIPDDLAQHRMIRSWAGTCLWTDRSGPKQYNGVVVMRKMPSKRIIKVSSHHRHKFGYIQSDSKQLKHNFNYWILFVCLTKFVSKLAMFLIEPSALQSRYSKS